MARHVHIHVHDRKSVCDVSSRGKEKATVEIEMEAGHLDKFLRVMKYMELLGG